MTIYLQKKYNIMVTFKSPRQRDKKRAKKGGKNTGCAARSALESSFNAQYYSRSRALA